MENRFITYADFMDIVSKYPGCNKYIIGGKDTEEVFYKLPGFKKSDTQNRKIGEITIDNEGTFPVFIHELIEPNKVIVADMGQMGEIKLVYKYANNILD